MADDGTVSDGSDIDDGDTEIGSNSGRSLSSLSSESDFDERHVVGEQWVRNLFSKDDFDNSVFAGFQATRKECDFWWGRRIGTPTRRQRNPPPPSAIWAPTR